MLNTQPNKHQKILRAFLLSPPRIITMGFAVAIFTGAFLLTLPVATQTGERTAFLDALFTATSATCVTGLVVVNTLLYWSWFGKIVILTLIQFGGLGFMTVLTIGMMMLNRPISLRDRMVIQVSFNHDNIGGMVRLVQNVVKITLVVEVGGALLLSMAFFASGMSVWDAIPAGIFQSISSFCNAGFDILGSNSLTPYRANLMINLVIMAQIVLGGLGFLVIEEICFPKEKKRTLRMRIQRLSLHSKIALLVSASLILSGWALFLLLEWDNPATLGNAPAGETLLATLFQSITLRTAGYNSIPQEGLTETSQFISCLLMLIGGSPSSTAGGLKTVTVGIIFFAMKSALGGRHRVEAFGRAIPFDLLQKALTVSCTILTVVFTSTLILHFTEQNSAFQHSFLDLLFESCSAAGTVGVTVGLTPHLSAAGKLVIISCMFLGRISPVTVVVALGMRSHAVDSISYPDERVIIG